MLTIDQIKNYSFKKASIGGYRADDVESFVEEAASTVEDLKKQNSELLSKLELIMKKVEEYRQNEETINKVLVKSQKDGENIVKEAQEEAQKIITDAKEEADRIIADANSRIIKEKEMINSIVEETAELRRKLIEFHQKQIDALNGLPDSQEAAVRKNKLNEKYPTNMYSEKPEETAPIVEEVFSTIEEAAEDAKAETAEAAAAAAESDNSTIHIEKSAFEKKFGKLKFGDDYDVKDE